jgi:hypothetical protein
MITRWDCGWTVWCPAQQLAGRLGPVSMVVCDTLIHQYSGSWLHPMLMLMYCMPALALVLRVLANDTQCVESAPPCNACGLCEVLQSTHCMCSAGCQPLAVVPLSLLCLCLLHWVLYPFYIRYVMLCPLGLHLCWLLPQIAGIGTTTVSGSSSVLDFGVCQSAHYALMHATFEDMWLQRA